ncbi:type II toxin-antitoxin system VapB family antitoxin [Vreelandella profundi]|uniref:type II toxin-antitoxin system VapB family antitoxin n=1 Tax=Vreelandella profundi TaxID=2852117 RepID=UPI001F349F6E
MRITITIDDALYEQALELAEPSLGKPSDIFKEALETYVRVQTARRRAALGGTSQGMQDIPLQRGESPTK